MGGGEDYYDQFYRWFSRLTPDEQVAYAIANKPPVGWRKFYETIKEHPWP